MASRALQGDGTLSGIGTATSLLALTALALYHALGWWQADRAAVLIVAAIAAGLGVMLFRHLAQLGARGPPITC